MSYTEVAIDLKAKDNMSAVLDHVSQKFGIFNKAGIGMGIAFAGINIAVAGLQQGIGMVVGFIEGGIDSFRKFETAMVKVENALGSLGATMVGSIKTEITSLATALGQSVTELAAAEIEIIHKGVSAADSLNVLKVSAILAAATFTDLGVAADAVASTLEAFNLKGKDAAYIAGLLASISNKTGVAVDELANVMERIAPTAIASGISIEELAGIIGKLGEKGLPVRMVMSQLLDIIKNLQQPSAEQQQIMMEQGMTYDDLTIKVYGLTGMLTMMKAKTEGNTDAMTKLVGGMQQFNAATFIIQAGLGKSEDIYKNYFSDLETMYNTAAGTAAFQQSKIAAVTEEKARLVGQAWSGGVQIAQVALMDFGINMGNMNPILSMLGVHIQTVSEEIDAGTKNIQDSWDNLTVDAFITDMNNINQKIQDQYTLISDLQNRISQYKKEIADTAAQRDILKETHQYNEALHYIPIALENAIYDTKIFDESTRALVDSIRIQRAEIKALSDANEALSLKQQQGSLEMLQIQQDADNNRGRMTREEKDRMKELEKIQTDLRIQEMQNDIAAQKIKQGGLNDEEQSLKDVETAYSEKVYIIQDAYNREVKSLQDSIDMKNALIQSHYDEIDIVYTNINNLIKAKLDGIDAYTKTWSDKMLAYYASVTGESLATTKANAQASLGSTKVTTLVPWATVVKPPAIAPSITKLPVIPPWEVVQQRRGYQHGGLVEEETAIVHRGEFVIPLQLTDSFMKKFMGPVQSIKDINDQISAKMDEWRSKELAGTTTKTIDTSTTKSSNTTITVGDKTPTADIGVKRRLGFYQSGGLVKEELGIVHKGEFVIPKKLLDSGYSTPILNLSRMREPGPSVIVQSPAAGGGSVVNNNTITVNVDGATIKDDVEAWGKKLAAGLASGFLQGSSSGTTTVTSRKTGGSIIVPGTTVTVRTGRTPTATIPVQQPIQNKGRFRVG